MIEILVKAKLSEQDVKAIAKEVAEINSKKEKVPKEKKEKTADVFYTVNEVAETLKKAPETIRYHIRQKLLKASKTGKSYSISLTNLNNYINGE